MNRIIPCSLNGLPKASFTAVLPQGKTSCRNFCVASTSLRFDLPTEVDGVQSSHSGGTHDLPVPPRCKPRFYHFTCSVPLDGVLSLPESVFLPDSTLAWTTFLHGKKCRVCRAGKVQQLRDANKDPDSFYLYSPSAVYHNLKIAAKAPNITHYIHN